MAFKLHCLAVAAVVATVAFASAQDVKSIEERIGKLRSLPDDKCSAETKSIALDLAKLPAGEPKLMAAMNLAFHSTEGDFGHETLQAVVNTLALSLKEIPKPRKAEIETMAYNQLAQMERYEGLKINLNEPGFLKARNEIDKLEKARSDANFTLTDLAGKQWTLKSLKGKVVLVNFWATWCPPCRKEMPDLEALSKEFASKGLVVLAISDEERSKVEPFIAEHKYTYPILLDPGRKVNTLFVVDGIPKTFIYDRNGKLAATSIDMRTRSQLLKLLAKAGMK